MRVLDDPSELRRALVELFDATNARVIASWAYETLPVADLSEAFAGHGKEGPTNPRAGRTVILPSPERTAREWATADIGVTGADAAVAETGAIALRGSPERPRAVSLLARIHVALIAQSRIVANTGQAMAIARRGPRVPSAVQFITGPSRSSDIENDLSIGVHGPSAVHIFVLREPNPIAPFRQET